MNSSDVAEVEELSEAEFMLPYTPCFFFPPAFYSVSWDIVVGVIFNKNYINKIKQIIK